MGPRTDIIDGSVRIIIHFQFHFYRDQRGRNRSGDNESKNRRRGSATIKMSRRRSLRGKEIVVPVNVHLGLYEKTSKHMDTNNMRCTHVVCTHVHMHSYIRMRRRNRLTLV
ncbi:hypothetical protein YC2023_110907 [Brassica napus]